MKFLSWAAVALRVSEVCCSGVYAGGRFMRFVERSLATTIASDPAYDTDKVVLLCPPPGKTILPDRITVRWQSWA